MLNYSTVFETMVGETAQYLIDNNLKTMVLGISGGIDSTVTAAICYEVVRRFPKYNFRFIGVGLPCTTNSDDENDSAMKTMKAFCKNGDYWVENLQKEYMLMKATCEQRLTSTNISRGNIKARLRMIYIYNIASVTGGLVMDTDNKSENALGFYTIHGDQGDFNPIGGLWKSEVYGLAKYLVKMYEDELTFTGIKNAKISALNAAITITPTDGNGVAVGGDMAQIAPGHTYEDVDDILSTYLEYIGHHSEEFQIAMNELYQKYGEETVNMVLERHRKSEFKRKRLPIVIKRELYEN